VSRTLAAPLRVGKSARAAFAAGAAMLFLTLAQPAAASSLSAQDLAIYKQAFKAADDDRHDEALRIAAQAKERLPAKLIRWMKLGAPMGGTFAEITAFIRENPDWPNQNVLRRAAEAALSDNEDERTIITWFNGSPPLTNQGFMRYADTLMARGEQEKAIKLVRTRWTDSTFNPNDEQDFLARYRSHLREQDHKARVDRLMWDRQEPAARRMLPFLEDGYEALIEARLALAEDRNVDAALARVPSALRSDPGLLYERVRHARRKNNDDAALEILQHRPPENSKPGLWWTERHILARRAIERGDYRQAYRLSKEHGPLDGSTLAEAEFLAGWLALRFLDQPSDAFNHFHKLYRAVTAPISKARGAYWCGRAAEQLGDRTQARDWYQKAAGYGTTFYGQLATRHISGARFKLPAEPGVSAAEASAFDRKETVRLARFLKEIEGRDDEKLAAFLRRVSLDAKTPEEYVLAARLAKEAGRPDLAIAAAKDAAQNDVYLVEAGYPVIRPPASAPEPALVHSLIRQESTFNPNIVSSAGARGLMQLMPATAQLVAKQLGIKQHNHAKLISDPQYNMRLGQAYMADLIERFNGSYVLAIASYNAGPGRVRGWMDTFGDPRTEAVDIVDWIELIPIYETRNYVQRVMEAMLVYRARLGTGGEMDLERELRR